MILVPLVYSFMTMLFNNCMIQVVRRVKCVCMITLYDTHYLGCIVQITLITEHLPHYAVHIVPCAIASITGISTLKGKRGGKQINRPTERSLRMKYHLNHEEQSSD